MSTSYKPKYKSTQMVYGGNSHISIVTGWTKIENIVKHIGDTEQYASVGNLYNVKVGIDYIVRNLILNPQVSTLYQLYLTQLDVNAGLSNLGDFFMFGVDAGFTESGLPTWIIRSNNVTPGYISANIPIEYLDNLRARVVFHRIDQLGDLKYYLKRKLNSFSPVEPLPPIDFPLPADSTVIRRGSSNGHIIRGKTVSEVWLESISRIRTQGFTQKTGYEGEVQGITNITTVVTDEGDDPENFFIPDYVPTSKEYMDGYIPYVTEDNNNPLIKYTYGSRLISHFGHNQIEEVVSKLEGEIIAASAVMSLWDTGRDEKPSDNQISGSPCLNHIQLQVCEGKLMLSALFRSQDFFMAYVPNSLALRALQIKIWKRLQGSFPDLLLGDLTSTARWGHIYQESFQFADSTIKMIRKNKVVQEYTDPIGNFSITLEKRAESDNLIICTEHLINEQTVTYTGHDPLAIIRAICIDNPNILPDHIGYLGIELGRAHTALKENKPYRMS